MTLRITVDTKDLQAGVDSLTEFLESVLEIRDGLVHLLDLPSRVAHVHRDGLATPGAGEARLALQPTQGFLDLVTAVRAGNVQLSAIKEAVDRASPSSHRTAPTLAQAGA